MLKGEIRHLGKALGGTTAHVEFVEINGEKYVLKTDTEYETIGQKLFQEELDDLGLAHITFYDHVSLKSTQLLMEYVNGTSINGTNFTNENLEKLGAALSAIHKRKFDQFYNMSEEGVLVPGHWQDFVESMMVKASRSSYDRSAVNLERAKSKIINQQNIEFTLCHGDAHGNNVLLSNKGLILFDNNADAIVATPHYDLAVIFGEVLTGYRYGVEYSQSSADVERLRAFLSGYGPVPDTFEKYIDDYVFLRLLARYPNPFIKYQDDIIAMLGERL